jgi:hypothetical protein
MKGITVNIKGTDWRFNLLSQTQYNKKYNDDTCGTTDPDSFIVDFNKPRFDFSSVIHELEHCFVFSSHVDSMDIDKHDMEELCCEINGAHITEILHLGIRIYDCLAQTMRPKVYPFAKG